MAIFEHEGGTPGYSLASLMGLGWAAVEIEEWGWGGAPLPDLE